jgi:hypothetical protein
MSTFCRRDDEPSRDAPSSALPVVDSAEAALATIIRAAHEPARPEVIVILLDPDLVGHTIVVVDGATSPDAVIETMEVMTEAAAEAGREQSFVVASIRPGDGVLPGDVDRWIELSDLADTHGCELLEWFVISDQVAWCPRDFLIEPPRWPEPTGPTSDTPR